MNFFINWWRDNVKLYLSKELINKILIGSFSIVIMSVFFTPVHNQFCEKNNRVDVNIVGIISLIFLFSSVVLKFGDLYSKNQVIARSRVLLDNFKKKLHHNPQCIQGILSQLSDENINQFNQKYKSDITQQLDLPALKRYVERISQNVHSENQVNHAPLDHYIAGLKDLLPGNHSFYDDVILAIDDLVQTFMLIPNTGLSQPVVIGQRENAL